VLIGKKAKLKYTHILPLALYCVVVVFNNLDIYFLDYQTQRDLFLQVRFIDKHYFSDIFVVRIIAMAMIIFDIFLNTKKYSNQKLADKSIASLRKEAKHLRWLYTFIILVTASTLISSFYYFSFLDPQYNAILYTLSRICTILSFVCMTLNPTIIPNVMQITKKIQKTATADISIFIKINETIKIDKLFLIKNITTRELATIIKIEEQEIIDSIKQHSDKNWKTYINSFRAEHAIHLLKTDYLKNVSVITLGEASGFTSHQSFFRAFKENTGTTPGKFYKAHHKIA
jgi:YesN/AraC family two-component response regulator